MTRCVEECDVSSVGELDVVGSDMLCDASCLTSDHVCLADVVEKRCLAVVYVSHDCDDRRTALEVFLLVFNNLDGFGDIGADEFGCESEFLGNYIDCLRIETLVDGYHHTEVHASGDDVVDRNIHEVGEVVGCHELGDFDH